MNAKDELAVYQALGQLGSELDRVRVQIESFVKQRCSELENEGLRCRLIESRVKTHPSVIRKLNDRSAGPSQLVAVVGDLVGIRAVVHHSSDVALLKAKLTDGLPADTALDGIEEKDQNGYRALHFNLRVGQQGIGAEIQVRTLLQDAWADASHGDVYKNELASPVAAKLAESQSDILKGVDATMQIIRDLTTQLAEAPTPIAMTTPPSQTEGEPPDTHLAAEINDALLALPADDRLVLNGEISNRLVNELGSGIEEQRVSGRLRRLFTALGWYSRRYQSASSEAYGIAVRTWKGPLVEGTNWAPYEPHDFAVSLETHVERMLGLVLQSSSLRVGIGLNDPSLGSRIIEASSAEGVEVIVVTGLAGDRGTALRRAIGDALRWDEISPGYADWAIKGHPVAWLRYPSLEPSVYVLKKGSLQMEQYNAADDSPAETSFAVRRISQPIAARLARDLAVRRRIEQSDRLPEVPSVAEAIVRLQLRVDIEVTEAIAFSGAPEPSEALLLTG